jgi:hypothetical protein
MPYANRVRLVLKPRADCPIGWQPLTSRMTRLDDSLIHMSRDGISSGTWAIRVSLQTAADIVLVVLVNVRPRQRRERRDQISDQRERQSFRQQLSGRQPRHFNSRGCRPVPVRSVPRRHHHCIDQHANCHDEPFVRGNTGTNRGRFGAIIILSSLFDRRSGSPSG